jgi:hypothetical protein
MRRSPQWACLSAFTAAYAVLAGFVFWGTWGLGVAPIMPDCPVSYPPDYVAGFLDSWLTVGKFVPGDILKFLGSPYLWTEFQYALAGYCAALGMAYFCRGRGLSRLASYGAGLLLAFSGYWFTLFSAGHLGWFQWMTYGVFSFGLADRAVRKGKLKNWAILGATVAWASFNQPDLWLLFTVFTAAYFVRCCIRERKLPWKGALVSLAFFLVIGLPSFRSAFVNDLAGRDKQIEEGQTVGGAAKDDAEKRWIFATNWSMPPEDTLEFLVPGIHGDTSCPYTLAIGRQLKTGVTRYDGALGRPLGAREGNYRQHSLYVGFLTCLLALLGLVFKWRNREVLFFAIAAFVFWLFSMGRYCEPVYRLVYALPFGDYLRAPVKWHHLTEFCLVVLAAYGIDGLLERFRAFGNKTTLALSALVLAGAVDLARVDRRYCVPQNVKCDYSFADGRQFDDPRAETYLRSMGMFLAGRTTMPGGNGQKAEVALIAVPKKPPAPVKTPHVYPQPKPGILALAVLSLLGTLVALFLALFGAFRRKKV